MKIKKNVIILGGDARQNALSELMKSEGSEVIHIKKSEELRNLDSSYFSGSVIVLPLPVSKDGISVYSLEAPGKLKLSEIEQLSEKASKIIGGSFPAGCFPEKNCFDFYKAEAFILKNAFLTAQGALKLALESKDCFFNTQKILISGFGRVAIFCAQFFASAGADVYICARSKEQRSRAECMGYKALDITDIEKTAYIFDIIISTVPANIFSAEAVNKMKETAIYIELASSPFGAKQSFFNDASVKYIFAPSLPGKLYPVSSAEIIYEAIKEYITEGEIC